MMPHTPKKKKKDMRNSDDSVKFKKSFSFKLFTTAKLLGKEKSNSGSRKSYRTITKRTQ